MVSLQKVLGRDLQRLGHSLADCNARHHDDELAPSILLVQLENSVDVAIGLARASFHFDIEIDSADLVLHQFGRLRQVLLMLNLGDVLK